MKLKKQNCTSINILVLFMVFEKFDTADFKCEKIKLCFDMLCKDMFLSLSPLNINQLFLISVGKMVFEQCIFI